MSTDTDSGRNIERLIFGTESRQMSKEETFSSLGTTAGPQVDKEKYRKCLICGYFTYHCVACIFVAVILLVILIIVFAKR